MRLSFHPDGTPAALQAETPETAATTNDKDLDIPEWAMRLLGRAFNEGRVTLVGGVLKLDGGAMPTISGRAPYTYGQALAFINGLTLSATPSVNAAIKEFLKDVLEVLAERGKVDL